MSGTAKVWVESPAGNRSRYRVIFDGEVQSCILGANNSGFPQVILTMKDGSEKVIGGRYVHWEYTTDPIIT